MGMFDELQCEMPLPTPPEFAVDLSKHWFQTKSLARQLGYYRIDANGLLWFKDFREDSEWIRFADFHGEIVFYTFTSKVGDETKQNGKHGWIEFSAFATEGVVFQIKLMRFEPYKFLNEVSNGK